MPALSLDEVAGFLRRGLPAIFPTDTVLGLGVAVAPPDAPRSGADPLGELFSLKGRDRGKPVAWLVGSADDLRVYGCDVPAYARELAARCWPGALTLVVQASDEVPAPFRGEAGTVGLRMPDSPVALSLLRTVGCPLATTSANLSGRPAVADARDLDAALAAVPTLGETGPGAGSRPSGVSSTVVDCTGPQPRVLRQGSVRVDL